MTIWGQAYTAAYIGALRDRLVSGEELTTSDRIYLAELLGPKETMQKRPVGRPKGSTRTEARNLRLCIEYLDLYNEHGNSDSAYKYLAERYKERESVRYEGKSLDTVERLIRKAVGGAFLQHTKILKPFILQEDENK